MGHVEAARCHLRAKLILAFLSIIFFGTLVFCNAANELSTADSVRQLLKRINPDLNRFLKTQIKESNPDGNLAFVNPRVEVMLKICRALDIISDEDLSTYKEANGGNKIFKNPRTNVGILMIFELLLHCYSYFFHSPFAASRLSNRESCGFVACSFYHY
eukprot:GHVT01063543.1.p2 GENE.GHVT01063543.1~~GHVT01063543.1.p2  ORF type:complete len:159 (+),score=6.90 GHVT01063543.1:209-685(+)